MHMPGMHMPKEPAPKKEAPTPPSAPPKSEKAAEPSGSSHAMMPGMQMPMSGVTGQPGHPDHGMIMTGALGPYSMNRESSGTAWQPDSSDHQGLHLMRGDWMLMAHGVLNVVADHQSGRRGDDKAFASGMLMGMARRPLGKG